ncbi:glutamine synthetase [Streptomyces panaciradicis]|uniref:glutamine synthetase n=1 Tax=Streptomyces panaciradicis TaxID=1470261 RepID=UPI00201CD28E|nr:glutamine synthetase [Streptomyces panaciradicis]
MAPLYAPTVNSYKRYQPHSFAPTRYTWGFDHRGCAVRVTGHGPGAHLEIRLAGADASAYVAVATYLAAITHGIEEKLTARPACDSDAYQEQHSVPLYDDLAQALAYCELSTVAHLLLGKDVVRHYAHAAQAELDYHRRHVTDLERQRGIRLAPCRRVTTPLPDGRAPSSVAGRTMRRTPCVPGLCPARARHRSRHLQKGNNVHDLVAVWRPAGGLSRNDAKWAFYDAIDNITDSYNNCGYGDSVGAKANFLSKTSYEADINTSSQCTDRFDPASSPSWSRSYAASDRTDSSAMTSRREPRLAHAAEMAAEQGLTPARIGGLYDGSTENGFPENADMCGRARLWDHATLGGYYISRTAAFVNLRAVRTALATASSGSSPHRSVSVKSASALTTTARSRLSWANASGSVRPSVSCRGSRAWSMSPKRTPGRLVTVSGRVMVAEIIARTAPCRASMPRSRNSQAKAMRSTGSAESATGARASAGGGHTPARASLISEGRSGKYR